MSNAKVDRFLEENFENTHKKVIKCTKCKGSSFSDHNELKSHYKSAWHDFNLQRLTKGQQSMTFAEYDDMILMSLNKD